MNEVRYSEIVLKSPLFVAFCLEVMCSLKSNTTNPHTLVL